LLTTIIVTKLPYLTIALSTRFRYGCSQCAYVLRSMVRRSQSCTSRKPV